MIEIRGLTAEKAHDIAIAYLEELLAGVEKHEPGAFNTIARLNDAIDLVGENGGWWDEYK